MQVPRRVPRHPLKSKNGCQNTRPWKNFWCKQTQFLQKNPKILRILSENFVCSKVCFELGTHPLKALELPLIYDTFNTKNIALSCYIEN